MPGPYNIKTLTFNAANSNLHKDSVDQLTSTLDVENEQPDAIFISFQEAANSWHGENLGERIAKRLRNLGENSEGYTLAYNESFRTMTKPFEIGKVGSVVLVRNDRLNEIIVEKKNSGQESWVHGFNKGGTYTTLRIGNSRVGLVGGHFDSGNEAYRTDERNALTDHFLDQKKHQDHVDSIILMGDLNERLHSDLYIDHRNFIQYIDHYIDEHLDQWPDGRPSHQQVLENTERHQQLHQELIERFDPLYNQGHPDGFNGFMFGKSEFLSYLKFDRNGNIKQSEDATHNRKIGALDNIGFKNHGDRGKFTAEEHSVHTHQITKPNGREASDHKAVTRTLTFEDIELEPRQKLTKEFERKIIQGFDLGAFGSSHKVTIDGKKYEVPQRVKHFYERLTGEENLNLQEEITTMHNQANQRSSHLLFFGRTQDSTNQWLENLNIRVDQ
ncbi:MAG: hypothetical protein EP298_02815 [Gammaproteobacteria bacterium]|nr:MAG: hypothetical protein EP298_02815 [Gammaproteobacteria bacterium]UTW43383.1 hypothetical protein KFE69_04620 [bacterium SCSIO 12844]